MSKRAYDVIVWGSTGFTGRLCSEYFARQYPGGRGLRWAIAGRNGEKLSELKAQLARNFNIETDSIPTIVASIDNEESMSRMAAQGKVVLSTAGPFDKFGTPVVHACVESGTHYVDITGEPQWVRKIIDRYHGAATAKKLKIVPNCGFDCVPVDFGCDFMVSEMKNRGWSPVEVHQSLVKMKGGASGGTIASALNVFDSCSREELKELRNPFALNPRQPDGTLDQPDDMMTRKAAQDRRNATYDSLLKKWTVPFVMQAIDTRVVNRSNALGKWKYGKNFIYSESMAMPSQWKAYATALTAPIIFMLLYNKITRPLVMSYLPSPGEGPSEAARENGLFRFRSWARGIDQAGAVQMLKGEIDAPHGDGGYKQTSVMVCEAAISLALDSDLDNGEGEGEEAPVIYGVLTPSIGLGMPYRKRLASRPGITFRTLP